MSEFTLTNGAVSRVFNTNGQVLEDGQAIGAWNTDGNNRIVVRLGDGTEESFAATWKFNNKNQLCLHQNGAEAFNFNTGTDFSTLPRYSTRNAVLIVQPQGPGFAFEFSIHGEWSLDADHILSFAPVGADAADASSIQGNLQDNRSRFIYRFRDQDNVFISSLFGFVGSWSTDVDEDGNPRLKFTYQKEDGSEGVFELAGNLAIKKSSNQFVYQYDRGTKSYSVQLVGFLQLSENFELTYTIDRQVANSGEEQVAQTSFSIQTRFSGRNFSGDLGVRVVKPDGGLGASLAIGGSFTAVLGSTQLQVGFSFAQVRDGNVVSLTFGFAGNLTFSNGVIRWNFQGNATTGSISLEIGTEIMLGPVSVDARLNFTTEGGRVQGVRFMLGVSF